MKSDIFSINWKDFLKGLIVTVLASVIATVQQMIVTPPINWNVVLTVAISALVGYLLKNFVTDGNKEAINKIQDEGLKVVDPTANNKTVTTTSK